MDKPLELAKNDGKKRVEQWMEMDQATKDKLKADAAKEAKEAKDAVAKTEKKSDKKDAKKAESAPAEADEANDDDPESGDNGNAPVIDPIRAEALNITSDLIELRKIQNTPNTAKADQP